jgi:4'-phosphopantetheinyl transferase
VIVTWSAVEASADEVLASAIDSTLGGEQVRTGRLCPTCASSGHGRPWARRGDVDVPVSISRAGGHLVTVVAPGVEAIGVDVEEIAAIGRVGASQVLAPGESAPSRIELARIWVAKEAILKAFGVGLATPMSSFRISDFPGRLEPFDAPSGFVAALASVERGQRQLVEPGGEERSEVGAGYP